MISIVRVKPYILLYRNGVKICLTLVCRGVKISLSFSNLIVDSPFDTYMPIFVSLRLANSSINSDKQTNKQNPSILRITRSVC